MELETQSLRIIPLKLSEFSLLLKGIDRMEQALGLTASNEILDKDTQQAMEDLYIETFAR